MKVHLLYSFFLLPVFTWSPICSSDIFTTFPFLSWSVLIEGKQACPEMYGQSNFVTHFWVIILFLYCVFNT